jgi:hypothetical protein
MNFNGLEKVYRFFRFLSLDIVLGVASGSLFACKVLKLTPPLSYKFLLALAVWTLYLTDHLVDGFRLTNKNPTTRYRKYYDNRKPIILLIIAMIIIALLILIFSFDRITFQFGLIIGIIVLAYFIFQQLRFRGKISAFPKEPVIAIVYTVGIWGVPFLISKRALGLDAYFIIFSFALMVLMNVQLYSVLQAKEDKVSGYPSMAGAFGSAFVYRLNLALGILVALVNLFIILWPANEEFRNAAIVFLGMDVLLSILNIISQFSFSDELAGILADATFFLPIAILLFKG